MASPKPPPRGKANLRATKGPAAPAPIAADAKPPDPRRVDPHRSDSAGSDSHSSNAAPSDTLLPGLRDLTDYEVTLADYTQLGVLGQGAFGKVWKGQSRATGWVVAVKQIHAATLTVSDRDQFEREVQVLVRCNNDFLLDFIGYTSTSPFCIVTSFMSGGSLWDAVHTRCGSLNPTQKTNIAMGIAHGMRYLHSIKIVHRDLKSPNVLLDDRMLPKVGDFGLGRFVSECGALQGTAAAVGTPIWMAPELIDAKPYGPPVDVYAFGIILWEMLTEKQPFDGLDSVQICAQVSAKGLRPELPETASMLARLIQDCWDADPARRPTFEEIYARFEMHAVAFPDCEPRGADILIHEIQQQDEISKSAAVAAANNLNEIIALRKAAMKAPEVVAALVKAAKDGDVTAITRLMGAYLERADLNGKDTAGVCPMHAAVHAAKVLVVNFLLKIPNVDKNVTDADGNSPLINAVRIGQPRIVQVLLGCSEVNVNLQNRKGQTALHVVALINKSLHQRMIDVLATAKTLRIDIPDNDGKKPLADVPDLARYFIEKQRA